MDLISIIIPVYNNEFTIKDCLNSILKQNYSNKEIIVIDDESSDGSLSICRDFELKYDNIKVYSVFHCGASACRNIGLRMSNGSLIVFCDADDTLFPDVLNIMRDELELNRDIDLVIGNVKKRNPAICQNTHTINKEEAIKKFFKHDDSRIIGTVYGKLFKRAIIFETPNRSLFFDENIIIGEDALFLLDYLNRSRQIQLIDRFVYHKKENLHGVIASATVNEYISALEASKKMIDIVSSSQPLFYLAVNDFCWVFIHILKRISSIEKAEILKEKFKSIIIEKKLNLRIINLPFLQVTSKKVKICYCSFNIGNFPEHKRICLDLKKWGICISPAFVNMHIHLKDYVDNPVPSYRSTEDYLEKKIINRNIDNNIIQNLSICLKEGCLIVAYSHDINNVHKYVYILHQSRGNNEPLLKHGYMITSFISLSVQDIITAFTNAKIEKSPIFFHLSYSTDSDSQERLKYSGSVIQYLYQRGLLNEFCFIIHGSYLTNNELRLISQSRANIILCPLAEWNANEKILPMAKLKYYGINWMIGSDSQPLSGTSSILDNAKYIYKQLKCNPLEVLYRITNLPIWISSKWRSPLMSKYILLNTRITDAKLISIEDIIFKKINPICMV